MESSLQIQLNRILFKNIYFVSQKSITAHNTLPGVQALPVPIKPVLQVQLLLPIVLVQKALTSQPLVPTAHSSISTFS